MHSVAIFVFLLTALLFPLPLPALAHESPNHAPYASAAVARMHETSHRLQNIADRIDTRATILAQSGIEVSAARPLLEEARAALMAADVSIENTTQTAASEHEAMREITARLIGAHASLTGALGVLKGADTTTGSTTASSTEVSILEVQ